MEVIDLESCRVTDEMFTEICVCQHEYKASKDKYLVAAIAAFKGLSKLLIYNCHKLTDNCIVNGIALNRTLTQLEIYQVYGNYDQFTETSLEALRSMDFVRNGLRNLTRELQW